MLWKGVLTLVYHVNISNLLQYVQLQRLQKGGFKLNYIEIDFLKVKGYDKLSKTGKELFERVYKRHNSCQGLDYKEDWVPVSVTEERTHLIVLFKNKEWLHYLPDGSWY